MSGRRQQAKQQITQHIGLLPRPYLLCTTVIPYYQVSNQFVVLSKSYFDNSVAAAFVKKCKRSENPLIGKNGYGDTIKFDKNSVLDPFSIKHLFVFIQLQ